MDAGAADPVAAANPTRRTDLSLVGRTGVAPLQAEIQSERKKNMQFHEKSGAARITRVLGIGAVTLLALAGCASAAEPDPPQSDSGAFPESGSGVVNLFNFTNAISPEALEKFTEETSIKVNVDVFSTPEEMVAKIRAGGAAYDVVNAQDYIVQDLTAGEFLLEINPLEWPNGDNIGEAYRDLYFDEGRKYTTPYQVLYEGIGVNPATVTEPVESWADYFAAPGSAAGLMSLHDGQTMVINAALLAVGSESCTTDSAAYERVDALLAGLKPSLKLVSSDGTIDRLAGGEVALSTMYDGAFARAKAQDPRLEFVFPTEGFMTGYTNWGILSTAQNVDNAKIFLNWLLLPENAALNIEFGKYNTPVTGVDEYLAPAGVTAPDEETLERALPTIPCGMDIQGQYDKVWTRFKG